LFASSLLSSLGASFSTCFQPSWFFHILSFFGVLPRSMLLGSVLFIYYNYLFLQLSEITSPFGLLHIGALQGRR
jgi:hypothetical protein